MLVGLAASALVAALLSGLHAALPGRTWVAIKLGIALEVALVAGTVAVYAWRHRAALDPYRTGFVAACAAAVVLAGVFLFWVWPIITFRADFLIWSESMFANDVLKLGVGYPLYTDGELHQSFIYTPGPPILTWLLTAPLGLSTSIVALRLVQFAALLGACFVAGATVQRLLQVAGVQHRDSRALPWALMWLPVLLLAATNPDTNPFTYHLHNSAMQMLVSMTAFYLIVRHAQTGDHRLLWVMMVLPGLGFVIKQSVAGWAGFFSIYIVLFVRDLPVWRRLLFAAGAFAGVFAAMGLCYVVFGPDFWYWTNTVLTARAADINRVRSLESALNSWPYFAAGLFGAIALTKKENLRSLAGPLVVWLAVMAVGSYTNGVAFKRHHLGQGSIIATIWMLAAVSALWPSSSAASTSKAVGWVRAGAAALLAPFVLVGLGSRWMPLQQYDVPDLHRYVEQIEAAVEGVPRERVLLDVGTWIYAGSGVIKKDSAIPIGDQGMSETSDFSGINQRLRERVYDKILMRNLEDKGFWYDWAGWRVSSNIKATLLDNYEVVGTIEGVRSNMVGVNAPYTGRKVYVLEPKGPSGHANQGHDAEPEHEADD